MTTHEIAKLFDDHALVLYRYVYLRIGHQADTEDIISAVFEKAVKHHEQYHPQAGATVRSWLFQITRTTMIDHWRKTGKNPLALEAVEELPATSQTASELTDLHLDWSRVTEAIAHLPDRQQDIVLLRYQAGLSNKEIAQALEIDQHTVAASLSKAISLLRTILN